MQMFEGLDLKGINPMWEQLAQEAEADKREDEDEQKVHKKSTT